MKKRIQHSVLFLIGLMAITACKNPHPGYKKTPEGFYYQLLVIGEDTIKPKENDYLTIHVAYRTITDSTFFQGKRKVQYQPGDSPSIMNQCLGMLSEGDKARFIIHAETFYRETLKTKAPAFLQGDDEMILVIEMLSIQSQQSYQNEKEAFLKWMEDFGEFEKTILKQYLQAKNITKEPTPSGLYHIVLQKGNGSKIARKDTVIFHYEGRFLHGKFFDSSRQRLEPFGLVYGQEWQIIPGLEEAIGRMREGEKALCIIPSELAWGKTGSSTGIIAPYTSLIFEVEILEVKSPRH